MSALCNCSLHKRLNAYICSLNSTQCGSGKPAGNNRETWPCRYCRATMQPRPRSTGRHSARSFPLSYTVPPKNDENCSGGACFPPRLCLSAAPLEMCGSTQSRGSTISATRPVPDDAYPYLDRKGGQRPVFPLNTPLVLNANFWQRGK